MYQGNSSRMKFCQMFSINQADLLEFIWELVLCHSNDFYAVITAKMSSFIIIADKD